MHQRNKGKKFFKEFCCLLASLSCLIFLCVMNPMEFVYDSQITTCSKNHPHRKPNYGGTAFLVVSNHLHNKKTTIFNKIFAANSQDVWEIYSCEKMRISQAQHEDFTNCQTSTQNGDRCWSIIEPFLQDFCNTKKMCKSLMWEKM